MKIKINRREALPYLYLKKKSCAYLKGVLLQGHGAEDGANLLARERAGVVENGLLEVGNAVFHHANGPQTRHQVLKRKRKRKKMRLEVMIE